MAKRTFRLLEKQLIVAAVLLLFLLNAVCSQSAFAEKSVFQQFQAASTIYQAIRDSNYLNSQGKRQKAFAVLKDVVALDPHLYSAEVHYRLASILYELKKYPQALDECKLSLKFDPKYEWAIYQMSYIYRDMEDYDNAIDAIETYGRVSKDPTSLVEAKKLVVQIRDHQVYGYLQRASKFKERQRFKDAVKILRVAEKTQSSYYQVDVLAALAAALERSGDPEEAIAIGQKALKLRKDSWVLYTIGISYVDLGYYDQAINYFEQYVAVETDEKSRQRTRDFIRDLKDDRDKVNPASMNKPDYMDELKKVDCDYVWPANKLPITVYIPTTSSMKGYKPEFRNYVIKALDTWCGASGSKLDYKLVDDKSKALLCIEWTNEALTLKEKGRAREKAGITYPKSTQGNKIESVVIRMRTTRYDDNEDSSNSEAFQVCMHEVGHALGLMTHSPSVCDVMFFGWSSKQNGFPSKRDKATIAKLYADYQKVDFVPKAPANSVPPELDDAPPPPPFFTPIRASDNKPLTPPMFMPPPLERKKELPPPPIFTPPPVSTKNANQMPGSTEPANQIVIPPMFVPTLKNGKSKNSNKPGTNAMKKNQAVPPMFVPPPKE